MTKITQSQQNCKLEAQIWPITYRANAGKGEQTQECVGYKFNTEYKVGGQAGSLGDVIGTESGKLGYNGRRGEETDKATGKNHTRTQYTPSNLVPGSAVNTRWLRLNTAIKPERSTLTISGGEPPCGHHTALPKDHRRLNASWD